jgi:hypothetical protein
MSHPAVIAAWWDDKNAVNRVHWPGVPLTKAEQLHYLSRADLGQDVFHVAISPPNNSGAFGAGSITGPGLLAVPGSTG